ncbi:uncharacterized protein METZ01_LOCUS500537 [marine metagenome]|uniref:Uncharacterized protein n=1 Tax=marine metagenome TaxID=408172 RepID=A0A383DTV1_9ZZZZ
MGSSKTKKDERQRHHTRISTEEKVTLWNNKTGF